MSLSPFSARRPQTGRWAALAAVGSVLFHGCLSAVLVSAPEPQKRDTWVEMTVQTKAPPPPPPKAPEPEPPKPEPPKPEPPKKQKVKFEELKKLPDLPPPPTPPVETPTPPKAPRRVVQGLSASSFAAGSGTNLAVNAGNSVEVAATKEKMQLDEATGPYGGPQSYSAVGKPPRLRFQPTMVVTEEAKAAGIEGSIKVVIDLDAKGHVTSVRVTAGLGYGLDESCAAAWRQSQWAPGEQNGAPVAVTGIPQKCTVDQIP